MRNTIVALVLALGTCTASAGGIRVECAGGRGYAECELRRIADPAPPTSQEVAASEERDAAWVARCKPEIVYGDLGIRHYTYSASGCEYGQLSD